MPENLTAQALVDVLTAALATGRLRGTDVLEKNAVGNLAVMRDGYYAGYISLGGWEFTVDIFAEDSPDEDPRP